MVMARAILSVFLEIFARTFKTVYFRNVSRSNVIQDTLCITLALAEVLLYMTLLQCSQNIRKTTKNGNWQGVGTMGTVNHLITSVSDLTNSGLTICSSFCVIVDMT